MNPKKLEVSIQGDILSALRKEPGKWLKARESLAGVSAIPDLIGCVPVTITPEMVGKTIGVYAAIEIKRPKKEPRDNQAAYLKIIKRLGGITGCAKSVEDAKNITKEWNNVINSRRS